MNASHPSYEQRAFAMSHAMHQDNLVQHYRLHLLAFNVAMVVGVAAALTGLAQHPFWQLALLPVLLWKHRSVSRGFLEAIGYRQKDVDWAQRQLLLHERALPATDRTFTKFKLYQDRSQPTVLALREAVLLSDAHVATSADIDEYFFAHRSQSRGKAATLLALPSAMTQVLCVLGFAHALGAVLPWTLL